MLPKEEGQKVRNDAACCTTSARQDTSASTGLAAGCCVKADSGAVGNVGLGKSVTSTDSQTSGQTTNAELGKQENSVNVPLADININEWVGGYSSTPLSACAYTPKVHSRSLP